MLATEMPVAEAAVADNPLSRLTALLCVAPETLAGHGDEVVEGGGGRFRSREVGGLISET